MGSRYLLDLADVCRRSGWPVIEVDGWQHRARGSGGYDPGQPGHVIVHHTASGPASDGWPDVNYCCYGNPDSPVGNLYLSRDGTVYVMAGGAANTNGSGQDPCGIVPDDSMNARSIAVEAGNGGTGEPWPQDQQDSYVALCRELLEAYGIGVAQLHSHFEWAPGRKIDPAGESAYAAGAAMWDMNAFRADVASAAPPPEPEPEPEPPEEDDVRHSVIIYAGPQSDTPGAAALAPEDLSSKIWLQYDDLAALKAIGCAELQLHGSTFDRIPGAPPVDVV